MGAHSVKVLAFDCSTSRGSLAVVQDEAVIFAEDFECPRGRGGAFFEVLDRAVRATDRPDRIAVGIGPGSYNGLRTAIAAAEGLRLATGAELVGLASVRALPCTGSEYVAVNDARGGVYFSVHVRDREVVGEFELLPLEELRLKLEARPEISVLASATVAAIPQAQSTFPDAKILASLALLATPTSEVLVPLYLKPAHITQPKRSPSLVRDN
jgi:tRNA threonylcarbamoyl adenosine modification protein YeaZ